MATGVSDLEDDGERVRAAWTRDRDACIKAANWEAAKGAALWTVGCTAFLVGAERFCTHQLLATPLIRQGPSWRTKVDRRFKVMIFGASFITGYWLYGETTLVKCGRQSTAR